MHSLLLGGRLITEQHFTDQAVPERLFAQLTNGAIVGADNALFNVAYQNRLEIYTAELNQICEWAVGA